MTSEQITVKGRLMQLNNLGKLKFLFLRCPDCDVQVCVSAIQAPVAANLLKFVSLGDHLQVIGHRARTTREELSREAAPPEAAGALSWADSDDQSWHSLLTIFQ
jgi:lysyl-tRNA synthetase class II